MRKKYLALIAFAVVLSLLPGCAKNDGKISNLNWTNSGNKVGDADGPAYVVYSNTGYHKASLDIALSKVKVNMVRKSDQKWTNTYLFLGIDIYNTKNTWVNCLDAGLCYSGGGGGWHLFYNRYTFFEGEGWWESAVTLDATHDYRILVDSSQTDEKATLSVIDMTDGEKVADSVTFELLYAKSDGSNTSYYQDYAIDFPDDVKMDTKGEPSYDNWDEITMYNTNEGIYIKNIKISNALLYDTKGSHIWTEECTKDRFMWPNSLSTIAYPCTLLSSEKKDYEMTLDLDMNK